MDRAALIGSRIRERRMSLPMRQADLAARVGISAAYLNLIEHNRRRIAGKLLSNIATELGVDVVALSEGAEAALLRGVDQASGDHPDVVVEADRLEEFAGRFPGWAGLVVAQNAEAAQLRQAVEVLNDRLSHDPFLATALHEVISTVSSIQSSASILVESNDLEKEWRDRFQRNIFEDSQRLAETSQSLVGYLDPAVEKDLAGATPQEEADAMLTAVNYDVLAEDSAELSVSEAGRDIASQIMRDVQALTEGVPDSELAKLEAETDDPSEIAARTNMPLVDIFRRLAYRPQSGNSAYGYISVDASGAIIAKRPIDGFTFPRLGAGCPLWPLYAALSQPASPIRSVVQQVGRDSHPMEVFAIAAPAQPPSFGQPSVMTAHMLLRPLRTTNEKITQVGVNCRICAVAECTSRREPTVLSQGF